jgi:hemolysin activation/secretion protein
MAGTGRRTQLPRQRPGICMGLAAFAMLYAQPGTAQIAPSQVTPRRLLPPPPVLPPAIEIAQSLPAEAPPGSDAVRLSVAGIVAQGGYSEMADTTQAVFAPLKGRNVSVGDLYRAAAALEAAYVKRGFFLARVVVPKQRVATGDTFRIVVVDGFVEEVSDGALPWQLRKPVHRALAGIIGKRKPRLNDLQQRLALAGAVPGARLRSTLAQGDVPGGAQLILDGRYVPLGLTLGTDNRLGPSFDNWGLNVQASINSPTGHGEQIYVFLSGAPRLDRAFRGDALRRVAGGGITMPLTASGIVLNPEFTVSDTNPRVANPLLRSNGTFYRGALNLAVPIASIGASTLAAHLSGEITDERQTLPQFNFVLSHDRLTVLRAGLTLRGLLWTGASAAGDVTVSHGIGALGARGAAALAGSSDPTSRGSDPQFTRFELRATAQQVLPLASTLSVTGRAQASFGTIVPNSETFDLTGMDSLSSFTAGQLSADGGVLIRGELGHAITARTTRLRWVATPYLFTAAGHLHFVGDDSRSSTEARSYGIGMHVAGAGFPLGAQPTATIEYGHSHANRGFVPDDRISVSFGVQF